MGKYVFSTITNDTFYCDYKFPVPVADGGIPMLTKKVLIKGGTGIASKHLVTPIGVVTNVTDEDYEFLMKNHHFNEHMKAGFLQVRDSNDNPEKVVAEGMNPKDESAPIVPEDFKESDQAVPAEGNQRASFGSRVMSAITG